MASKLRIYSIPAQPPRLTPMRSGVLSSDAKRLSSLSAIGVKETGQAEANVLRFFAIID